MVEVLMSVGLLSITVFIIFGLYNNQRAAETMQNSISEANTYVGIVATGIKSQFYSRRPGQIFHCSDSPILPEFSYCLTNCSPAPSGAAAVATFSLCKSLVFFTGNPEDPATNPKRIDIDTVCESSTQIVGADMPPSICGVSCPANERPVTRITTYSNTTTEKRTPSADPSDRIKAFETCFSKASDSGLLNVSTQAYFKTGVRKLNSTKFLFSIEADGSSVNENLIFTD